MNHAIVACLLATISVDDQSLAPAARASATRALAAIEKSVQEYPNHRSCFSCHHQGVPAFALRLARERGFTVAEESFDAIDVVTTSDLELAQPQYAKGQGQGGGSTRAGYALWTLKLVDHEPDVTTRAVASFLAGAMRPEGAWRTSSSRPPSEASWLTTTAVALQALDAFPIDLKSETATARQRKALDWLLHVEVKETEEQVFRLRALALLAPGSDATRQAAALLREEQNADGGWSQKPDLPSDAYATGSVLVALHQAGGLPTNDVAYQRGALWLIAHQQPDGTWHVASRSKPFQPYFESGFPYGKDQFISISASSWAAAALVLASATP